MATAPGKWSKNTARKMADEWADTGDWTCERGPVTITVTLESAPNGEWIESERYYFERTVGIEGYKE